MYRDNVVYIASNKLKDQYKGFEPDNIKEALTNLSEYINNTKENIYIKALVAHLYFEIIHPYYDYNGRVGRFIPLWIFCNQGRLGEMMYFATAIGNYKDQYISLFRKNIDPVFGIKNIDRILDGFLDMLILNQKQYFWYKKLEIKYTNNSKKSFSNIQKNIIWRIMIKMEISHSSDAWFKFTKNDIDYIETNITPQLLSNNTKELERNGIIEISKDLHKKYKLLNYVLLK